MSGLILLPDVPVFFKNILQHVKSCENILFELNAGIFWKEASLIQDTTMTFSNKLYQLYKTVVN